MEGFQKFQPFFQTHRYINNPRYIYAYTMDSHAAMHWSSGNFPFFQISKKVNTFDELWHRLGSRGPHVKPAYSFVQKVLFIHWDQIQLLWKPEIKTFWWRSRTRVSIRIFSMISILVKVPNNNNIWCFWYPDCPGSCFLFEFSLETTPQIFHTASNWLTLGDFSF